MITPLCCVDKWQSNVFAISPHSTAALPSACCSAENWLCITITFCSLFHGSCKTGFMLIGSVYGITTYSASVGQIKSAVWARFTETVWKFCYVCIILVYWVLSICLHALFYRSLCISGKTWNTEYDFWSQQYREMTSVIFFNFCRASAHWRAYWYSNSVCPSVHLSVTFQCSVEMAEHIVIVSSPHNSQIIPGGAKYRLFRDFWPISHYILQLIEDSAMVTIEGE